MLKKQQLDVLYQYCFSLTGDSHSAFDLLQTSLEKLLNTHASIEPNIAYIRRIIRNQFIDQYRRNNRITFETFEENTPVDIDSQTLENCVINQDTLIKLWQKLTPVERETLYLWAALGYSTSEIAVAQDSARGTVLSRIHRIRRKIAAFNRDDYKPKGGQSR